ncbi:MAG: hypothetical protein Q6352_001935 [Candidatus Freyrarchaeum guaymaensis]
MKRESKQEEKEKKEKNDKNFHEPLPGAAQRGSGETAPSLGRRPHRCRGTSASKGKKFCDRTGTPFYGTRI